MFIREGLFKTYSIISKRIDSKMIGYCENKKSLNLVKDQLFFSGFLFSSHQENTKMNLINSVQKRVVEYQIKQLKNELAKLEE